jgi:Bifunctional DNA primase/polymerase, N-terminal
VSLLRNRRGYVQPNRDRFSGDTHSFVESVRKAARDNCDLGLRVLPLKPMSKEPLYKKWQVRATSDPDQIDDLFPENAPYNLGVATGKGLLVVDIDPRNGGEESWEQVLAQHDPLPRTATARTGSDGRHVLFRVDPESTVVGRVGLWPGVDIKGDGGQIVVSPSLHPTTGEPYEWIVHPNEGIAPPPPWLLQAILGRRRERADGRLGNATEDRSTEQLGRGEATEGLGDSTVSRSSVRGGEPVQSRSDRRRTGDIPALTEEVIRDFPVPGEGQRHHNMRDAIGRLFTRLYDEETIVEVMMGWWSHYFSLGRIRTDREGMETDLRSCLNSTYCNRKFCLATREEDHIAACAGIELTSWKRDLLKWPPRMLRDLANEHHLPGILDPQPPPSPTPCKRVTQRRERLCMGDHEEWFVEALVSLLVYKGRSSQERTLLATNSQIGRIAVLRRAAEPRSWDNQQIERLKRKYITRPGKRATIFELVREVRKGACGKGTEAGTPSEYEPTGILIFLDQVAQSPSLPAGDLNSQSSKSSDVLNEETHLAPPIRMIPGHAA